MAVSAAIDALFAMGTQDPDWTTEVLEPDWVTEVWAWSTTVLAAATVVLAIAALFGLRAVGQARKVRNADVMMELSQRWDSEDAVGRRAKIDEYIQRDPNGHAHPRDLSRRDRFQRSYEMIHGTPAGMKVLGQVDFLENLAILVRARGIDIGSVNASFGPAIAYYWSLWKPAIHMIRDKGHEQGRYKNFEDLAATVAPYWPESVKMVKAVEAA